MRVPSIFRSAVVAVSLIGLGATVSACGDDSAAPMVSASADTITVTDASVQQPAEGQPNAGVFGTILNDTDGEIKIVGATSPVSSNVQLHFTVTGDDAGDGKAVMSMQEAPDFTIPAHKTFALESGGPHIMLLDIDAATFPTDAVPVTLQLEDGTEIPFTAGVVALPTDTTVGS